MTDKTPSVKYLLVEDDPLDTEIIGTMLRADKQRPVQLTTVTHLDEARRLLEREKFSALMLDLNGDIAGATADLTRLAKEFPLLPIVALTPTEDQELAFACLQLGAQDTICKHQINAELLTRVMNYAVERKRIDSKLKSALEMADKKNVELSLLARTDTLTMLPNRAYFYEVAEQAIAAAERMKKSLGMLYFDLNGFKAINDRFGHGTGDEVLIEISNRLKEQLRHGDIVARMGGDEFVVLTTMLDDPVQSYSAARKIHQIISAPMIIDGYAMELSASIGIATFPEVATVEHLIENADLAMYEAKSSKQHFACFYTKKLAAKYNQQRMIEEKLESSVDVGEMSMAFQPIVVADDDSRTSLEALARWHNQEMGIIKTAQFIPIAEATNFGDQLDELALTSLATMYEKCQAQGFEPERLIANVFAYQFTAKNFALRLLKRLEELNLPPEKISLEIPERQLVTHMHASIAQFHILRSRGIKVTLDNFGSGELALRHLQRLPLDYIKFDKSLVADIDKDESRRIFPAAMINMAHTLGIKVIAGGIERKEEYEVLRDMHCDEFQGYYFGKPEAPDILLAQWAHPSVSEA